MLGVDEGAYASLLGIVRLLVVHLRLRKSDFPVAMPSRPALLVEIKIGAVSRIASVTAPDLQPGLRISRKDGHRVAFRLRPVDDVRTVDGLAIGFTVQFMGGKVVEQHSEIARHHLVWSEKDRFFDEV